MSNRQQNIRRTFDELLHSSGEPGQRVRNRIDQGAPINLYAARTFPHKNVLLEIGPIKKAYLPAGFTRPRIKGLNISVDSHQKAAGVDLTLLLELQQTEYIDVFVTFIARVCEEMEVLKKPADAVRAVIALVERWKGFFAGNSELLSEGRQTGLYGELHLMACLVNAGLPIDQLVKAWTGSKRTNQDYEFGDVSIEVKSTAAVDATTVSITNIRQLDETGLELLLLSRVLLDARQGNEHTLPILINTLRAAIEQQAPEMTLDFEEKILQAKYRNNHAEHYANRTYAERGLEFYEVREGFPRLVESDLPTGVTKASYEITLENCKPFEQPLEDVFAIMRKHCD
jgi:hypothetical protein